MAIKTDNEVHQCAICHKPIKQSEPDIFVKSHREKKYYHEKCIRGEKNERDIQNR